MKSAPKKVVMKSAPKEDEVRPARIGAPPIPKAKDFVKVGVKPKKQARIDTNAPRNVGKVDTKLPKEKVKKKVIKFTKKQEALRQKIIASNKKKEEENTLTDVEKNRCLKAVNNAKSVIRLYEKQKGKIKDSDFSSKKDLMETIKDIRDMLPQLKSCPKSEQDIINKALSLVDKPKGRFKLKGKDDAPKKPQKSIEEKKKGNVERNKLAEIRKGINRIKDVVYLREIIDKWNGTKKGKALEKTRGQPLRNTDNITKLKQKIMSYKMYEDVK